MHVIDFFMQVITCQWIVVIQLLKYSNLMNIERMDSGDGTFQYCCCDAKVSSCGPLSDFHSTDNKCASRCDILFVTNVSICPGNSGPCPNPTSAASGTLTDSPPESLIGQAFTFVLNSNPNQVRY